MGIEPIITRASDGTPVVAYRVTFDGRKITVHGPDGPRTRTRRNTGGYATAAALREMGYTDLFAMCPDGTTDVYGYTARVIRKEDPR